METSLHRDLKLRYASSKEATEISIDGFRIDAIGSEGELIEVQHASLGALKSKTKRLLDETTHQLRIVKPIVAKKRLITLTRKNGKVKRSRMSPKKGQLLDIYEDLVHFSTVFPRPRLVLEIVLIEAEEIRVDRSRPTRRGKRHRTIDQCLTEVVEKFEFRTAGDLLKQLPIDQLQGEFDTAQLGEILNRPRWFAQKVAYCLRKTGALTQTGKRGKAAIYRIAS